jgi:glycosyltransferase involved in cell wall biosynthesis
VRVLLSIHHELDPNAGAPGSTLQLGSAFSRLGHEASYLSFENLPRRLPLLGKELLYPEFAAWKLRRADADVLDASTGDAWLWALLRPRRRRRPLLVTRSHGLEHRYWEEVEREARVSGERPPLRSSLYHGRLRLREVAASLRAADVCVFLNSDDLRFAVDRLGVERSRARVMLNGLPEEFVGVHLTPSAEGPRIAHVGSYAERKGVRYAVDALGRILLRHEDVVVSFLGARVPAEQVICDFPPAVRARVRVVPEFEHSELPRLLGEHELLVSASLAEGFSLALPEGMACGLAPVATSISGSREIVEDGSNGLLVPPRDSAALERALERLVSDTALRDRLRRAAHGTAQRMTWTRIAEETLALYDEARRRRPASGRS